VGGGSAESYTIVHCTKILQDISITTLSSCYGGNNYIPHQKGIWSGQSSPRKLKKYDSLLLKKHHLRINNEGQDCKIGTVCGVLVGGRR
jgi:hypothetical protein